VSRECATSRSLLVRARRKDAEAWDRLVALYAPLVMYWLRRWNLNEAEAADVFQEVFQAVATKLDTFRKEREADTFRGWLRTIARNKTYDHLASLGREPAAEGGTNAFVRFAQIPVAAPDAHDVETDDLDAGEISARDGVVRRALEQIRGHFRQNTWQAFWRVVVDGQSAGDVADELGMSPGAVRVAKSRVLHRLREELGDLID